MFNLIEKAVVAGYHLCCGFIMIGVLPIVRLTLRLYADYRDWKWRRHVEREIASVHGFSVKMHRCMQLYDQKEIAFLIMRGDTYFLVNQQAGELHGDPPELMYGRTPADYSPEFQRDGERSMDKAKRLMLEAKETRGLVRFLWDAELANMEPVSLQVNVLFVGTIANDDYFVVVKCIEKETIPEGLMPHRVWGDVPARTGC